MSSDNDLDSWADCVEDANQLAGGGDECDDDSKAKFNKRARIALVSSLSLRHRDCGVIN